MSLSIATSTHQLVIKEGYQSLVQKILSIDKLSDWCLAVESYKSSNGQEAHGWYDRCCTSFGS